MAKSPVKVGGVYIDTALLDKITEEMRPKAHKIIGEYGFSIAGDAALMAPYKDGGLSSSILSESNFIADLTYRVQDGVAYGLRMEFGFHDTDSLGRRYNQAARPFMVPALEKWRDKFLAAFKELFK